jgi:hypothetical protein
MLLRRLAILSLLLSYPAFARVSCDDLNRAWADRLHADFKVEWPKKRFACPSVDASIAEAFHELHYLELTPDAKNYAPAFYQWVVGLTQRTVFDETDTNGYLATAAEGTVTLLKSFVSTDLMNRAAALVHEARHQQSLDPSHVTCNHGLLKGEEMGCDENFHGGAFEGSGYNYGFVFVWWVSKAAKRTNLDKQLAASHTRWMFLNRFNNVSNADVQKFAR